MSRDRTAVASTIVVLAVLAALVGGCGARGAPDPAPPGTGDAAPAGDDLDDAPEVTTAPDPDPTPEVPPSPEPPDDTPEPEPPQAEAIEGAAVPGPIAALFTLPSQVRVDEAGTSTSSETVEVVQLTGEFVDGDLAAAVRAFDAALAEADLPPNRDVTPDGAVYVVPIDERTLAIGLLVDRGTVFVSVDLLTDRRA